MPFTVTFSRKGLVPISSALSMSTFGELVTSGGELPSYSPPSTLMLDLPRNCLVKTVLRPVTVSPCAESRITLPMPPIMYASSLNGLPSV